MCEYGEDGWYGKDSGRDRGRARNNIFRNHGSILIDITIKLEVVYSEIRRNFLVFPYMIPVYF